MDGRAVRQQRASLGPNTSATVTFEPFPLPPRARPRHRPRAPRTRLAQDDAFHFVLAPGGDLPVLVLENGPPRGRSLYLQRALAIGHRPRFRVEVKDVAQLQRGGPRPGHAGRPQRRASAERSQRPAAARVRGGGRRAPGRARRPERARRAGRPRPRPSCPAPFGAAVDRSADWGATLAYVDYGHPVFELFRGPHSGDFSSARFFRYRPLEAKDGVLARFDDGAVALADEDGGQGPRARVDEQHRHRPGTTSPCSPCSSPSCTSSCAMPPATWSRRPGTPWARRSTSRASRCCRRRDATALAPSGERVARSAAGQPRPRAHRARLLRGARRRAGGPPLQVAAVNVDRAESDLAAMDPEELAGAVTRGGAGAGRGARAEPALTTDEHESRQALWQYLLMAAFLLLATETVLSNRLSARATSQVRAMTDVFYDELRRVIHGVRRRWRLKIALRGIALVVATGLLTFAVSAYAMDHFRYEPWAVSSFRIFAYVTLVALAARFLVVPLWGRVTEERVALYVEEHEPSLQAAVLSAVEVGRQGGRGAPTSRAGSSSGSSRTRSRSARRSTTAGTWSGGGCAGPPASSRPRPPSAWP